MHHNIGEEFDCTMKLDTVLNHIEKFETRIFDIYTSARIYGTDSNWINNQMAEKVYNDPSYKIMPRWAHSQLSGYRKGIDKLTWKYEILWTLELDGVRYPSQAKEFEGNYSRVCNGAHVWKQHFEKGKTCFFTHPDNTAVTAVTAVTQQ